jgi:plasmid stability protein
MSMLQVKNVPEALKRKLRKRARDTGTTMSEYVLRLLRQHLDEPTPEEILARLERLSPVEGVKAADLLAEARAEIGE